MTENPDAVKVALLYAKTLQTEADLHEAAGIGSVGPELSIADARTIAAILGARAMQAAMSAPAGVRVPAFPRYGHLPAREFLLLASYCGGDNDECTDARPCADCLAMCNVYAEDSQFLRSLGANPAKKAGVPAPLYKRVEAILDEQSAWIARPNDEVTKRVALAAMFAAHSVLIEEDAPGERYLRDGAAPTPAGAGDLVERLRWGIPEKSAVAGGGQVYDFNALHALMTEAASRIEALEAEVARLTEEADGDFVAAAVRVMQEYPGFEARDYEFDGISADDFEQFFSEDMREAWRCAEAAEARATTAEADLAALRSNYDTAQANWDLTLDRAEKAEAELAALRAEVVPESLRGQTFAVQHNPNCPSPWLVRLPGKSGVIDLKPYGGWMVKHETGDRLGFGRTFNDAALDALAPAKAGG